MPRARLCVAVACALGVEPGAGCTSTGIGTLDDGEDQPAEDVDVRIVQDLADSTEPVTRTFEIPADSAPYQLLPRIEPPDGSGPCAAVDAQIEVLDPNGTRFAEASTMGTVQAEGESCGATPRRATSNSSRALDRSVLGQRQRPRRRDRPKLTVSPANDRPASDPTTAGFGRPKHRFARPGGER
jgi:hypothetical protein